MLIMPLVRYLTNSFVSHLPSYTLRYLWYRHLLGVYLGAGASVQTDVYWYIRGPARPGRPTISIGRRSVVNRACVLDGRGGLCIGDDVSISPGVWLLTDSHDLNDPLFGEALAPINIGNRAWLGSRALVLPGVSIGEGAVVAAGGVVTRDVSPYTVVAGVPAQPIGTRRRDLDYTLAFRPFLSSG
jgi:maltose O-acetyltransferase